MQVLHHLSALWSAVNQHAVAFGGNPQLLRQLFRDLHHMPDQHSFMFGDIVERNDVLRGIISRCTGAIGLMSRKAITLSSV